MPLRLDSQSADFAQRFAAFLGVKREAAADVEAAVRTIIADVAARGDRALAALTLKFDRVDLAKIALARSFGASTLQIFTKIRIPMAMPMIIVGLMVGSIFGLLTAIGAEMVGGAEGLGNRLTYYSALIRMPQFFAIILILAIIGISIYVFFYWLGKKWASWEA